MQAQTLQFLHGLFPIDVFEVNVVDATNLQDKNEVEKKEYDEDTPNDFYNTPHKTHTTSEVRPGVSFGALKNTSNLIPGIPEKSYTGNKHVHIYKVESETSFSVGELGDRRSLNSSTLKSSGHIPFPKQLVASPSLEELAKLSNRSYSNRQSEAISSTRQYNFRIPPSYGEKPFFRSRRASSKLQRALNLSSESRESAFGRGRLAKSTHEQRFAIPTNKFENLSSNIMRDFRRSSNNGFCSPSDFLLSPSSSFASSRNSNPLNASSPRMFRTQGQTKNKPLLDQARIFARSLSVDKENSLSASNYSKDVKQIEKPIGRPKAIKSNESKTNPIFTSLLYDQKAGHAKKNSPPRRAFSVVRREDTK